MKSDRLTALVLMVFSVIVFLYAKDWQMEAGLYPRAIAVLIFVLSGVLFIRPKDKTKKTLASMWTEAKSNWKVLAGLAMTVAFIALIEVTGFFVVLPVFLIAMQLLMGARNWKSVLLSTVIITVVIYLIFITLLGIRIPIAFWNM